MNGIMDKIIHKIFCLLDEHTPDDGNNIEDGLYPYTIRRYHRCKYCNKRIQKHTMGTWYAVSDDFGKGD